MSGDNLPESLLLQKSIRKARLKIDFRLTARLGLIHDATINYSSTFVNADLQIFIGQRRFDRAGRCLDELSLLRFITDFGALICAGEVVGNNSVKRCLVAAKV